MGAQQLALLHSRDDGCIRGQRRRATTPKRHLFVRVTTVARVRVYELAKEVGVESKDLLTALQRMGEYVRSASSTVEPGVVRQVRELYGQPPNKPPAERRPAAPGAQVTGSNSAPKPSPELFRRNAPRVGVVRQATAATPDQPVAAASTLQAPPLPDRRPPIPIEDVRRLPARDSTGHAESARVAIRTDSPTASRRPGWHAGPVKAPTDPRLLTLIDNLGRQYPEALVHLEALRRLGSQIVHVGKAEGAVRPARVRFSGAIESAFGLTREVLFLYCPYVDLQTKTIYEGQRILKRQDSFVAPDIVFISSPDPRLAVKLKDWSTPSLLLVPLLPSISDDPQALIQILRQNVYSRDLFYITTPVEGARFFGRKTLLQELRDDVRHGRIAGLYGLRKAGKTSILKELASTAEPDLVPILVDLESFPCPPEDATSDILAHITRRIEFALKERGLTPGGAPTVGPNTSISLWKQRTQETLEHLARLDIRILLFLDEVEYLTSDKVDIEEGDMPRISQMLASFRSLAQESSNFTFMLAGLTSAITESGRLYGRPNPLFSWAKTYYVSPFTRTEADELTATLGAKMGIHFDETALEALHDGSGGHAFLYRSLASAAVEQLPDEADERRIGVVEIQRAYLQWRGAVAGHVREMLNHVRRYYGVESLLIESLMGDGRVFKDLATSEPQAVVHLMKLGLIYEANHQYHLNSLLELSK